MRSIRRVFVALMILSVFSTESARGQEDEVTLEQLQSDYVRLKKEREELLTIRDNPEQYDRKEVEFAKVRLGELDNFLKQLEQEIIGMGGNFPDPNDEGVSPSGPKQNAQDPDQPTIPVGPNYRVKAADKVAAVAVRRAAAAIARLARPWEVGRWPWRFDQRPELDLKKLTKKYYDLQAELRETLLITQDTWTYEQATNYNGRVIILSKLLIDTEENIAFGLGDWKEFDRAIRQHKQKFRLYIQKQRVTDAREAEMEAIRTEFEALMKQSGLKPGDTVDTNDDNARQLAYLQAKYNEAQERFLEARLESEAAKYNSGTVREARDQRIRDGETYTLDHGPRVEVHRKLLSGSPGPIYKMFLSKEEHRAFLEESKNRLQAIKQQK